MAAIEPGVRAGTAVCPVMAALAAREGWEAWSSGELCECGG